MWGSLDSSPDHHFYDYATGRAEIARTIKMRPWREREQVDRCGTWTQIRLSKMPKKKKRILKKDHFHLSQMGVSFCEVDNPDFLVF